MRISVAIDSFKGSISSKEAGEAVKKAATKVFEGAFVDVLPLADGGEGTVDAICSALGGELIEKWVCGPFSDKVLAKYGFIKEKGLAVIEMSSASGITLVPKSKLNPMLATTYGVGELISDALMRGARKFIVGIGGSATNDGGVGMLTALGVKFYDKTKKPIPLGAGGLSELDSIDVSALSKSLSECEILVACDVKNPLCGENGASAVFGPQKGATPEMVKTLDSLLERYAEKTKEINPSSSKDYPGSGAAGGLGFAFISYLGARLTSGIELVIKETGIEESIKNSDLVITGEGRLDGQSAMGKAPVGIARLAKKYGKTVIAFSGAVTDDAGLCNENGIDAFFPILRSVVTLDEAMKVENAEKNLEKTAEQALRLVKALTKA